MVYIHKKYVINLSVIQILLKVGWKTYKTGKELKVNF